MKKSTTALGEELFKTGVNVAKDVWRHGDLAETKKKRGREFLSNVTNRVADHMFGSGYPNNINYTQLARAVKPKKTRKRKAVKRRTKKTKKNTKKKSQRNLRKL